jgi:hypothetical protein
MAINPKVPRTIRAQKITRKTFNLDFEPCMIEIPMRGGGDRSFSTLIGEKYKVGPKRGQV